MEKGESFNLAHFPHVLQESQRNKVLWKLKDTTKLYVPIARAIHSLSKPLWIQCDAWIINWKFHPLSTNKVVLAASTTRKVTNSHRLQYELSQYTGQFVRERRGNKKERMHHFLHLKVCSQLSTLPRERKIQSKDPTRDLLRDVRTYRDLCWSHFKMETHNKCR